MTSVAILGGGISGLTTAYYLLRHGKPLVDKIVLLEAQGRFGGWIQSHRHSDGSVFEMGPRSMRSTGQAGLETMDIVDQLNLQSQLVAIFTGHPTTRNRLLMVDDQLHLLPSELKDAFKKSPPFTHPLYLYALRDLFRRRRRMDEDTMFAFAERRFGKEIAEMLIDPLCRGVFAGDARQLSVHSLLSTAFDGEQKHGSVILSLIKKQKETVILPNPESELLKMVVKDRWSLWSLRNGLETLVESLVQWLRERDVELRTDASCKHLHFDQKNGGLQVDTDDGYTLHCQHVFAALPSYQLADALSPIHSILVDELRAIKSVTVGVVNLEYEGSVDDLLKIQAFGFLIPSSQRPEVLGVTYDSCIFPELDSTQSPRTRFTAMLGGSWFEEHYGDPDRVDRQVLIDKSIEAINKYVGIKTKPIRHLVNIQKKCIPQYAVGHLARVKRMQEYIKDASLPLSLIGNSYHGVAINDCIAGAKLKVQQFVENNLKKF